MSKLAWVPKVLSEKCGSHHGILHWITICSWVDRRVRFGVFDQSGNVGIIATVPIVTVGYISYKAMSCISQA